LIAAQVIRSFGGGGAQRAAVNLAVGLHELGYSSGLIAVGELGRFASGIGSGLACHALGVNGVLNATNGILRLRRLIQENSIENLHVHGSGVLPFVVAAVTTLRKPPRIHFTWHDSSQVFQGSWRKRIAWRWSMEKCESISTSSTGIADKLRVELPGKNISVLWNGVRDTGFIGDPGSPKPRVIWAARIVPEKRPEWFVNAAALARNSGLLSSFVLAGSPFRNNSKYFESVCSLAQSQNAPVQFPGWVEDPVELLSGASIGVQTSNTEGLSLSLLEQMMAGLAVVATDVGDTSVALGDGAFGRLVDPECESKFQSELLGLIEDASSRLRLGEAARLQAQNRHSCQSMAQQMVPLYQATKA